MKEEELNHLKCLETENKLLIKHNKDLINTIELLNTQKEVLKEELNRAINNVTKKVSYIKGDLKEIKKDQYVKILINKNKRLSDDNKRLRNSNSDLISRCLK